MGLFSGCLRGFWVVWGWIWLGGGARVKLFELPPLLRGNGDRLPFKLPVSVVLLCAAGWCGGPGSGLLCAAGSGKFEKLLRSDLGPFWVWVVPVSVCCLRTQ